MGCSTCARLPDSSEEHASCGVLRAEREQWFSKWGPWRSIRITRNRREIQTLGPHSRPPKLAVLSVWQALQGFLLSTSEHHWYREDDKMCCKSFLGKGHGFLDDYWNLPVLWKCFKIKINNNNNRGLAHVEMWKGRDPGGKEADRRAPAEAFTEVLGPEPLLPARGGGSGRSVFQQQISSRQEVQHETL